MGRHISYVVWDAIVGISGSNFKFARIRGSFFMNSTTLRVRLTSGSSTVGAALDSLFGADFTAELHRTDSRSCDGKWLIELTRWVLRNSPNCRVPDVKFETRRQHSKRLLYSRTNGEGNVGWTEIYHAAPVPSYERREIFSECIMPFMSECHREGIDSAAKKRGARNSM
jgi:hypothetical protein